MRCQLLPLLLLLGSPELCLADLIINVDTIAKDIWVSGSDSGTQVLTGGGTQSYAEWRTPDYWMSSADGRSLIINDAISLNAPLLSASLTWRNDGEVIIDFVSEPPFLGTTTYTGTGTRVSYKNLPAIYQQSLENIAINSTVVPLQFSSGFSSISFAAVPEPSSVSLICLSASLLLLRRRFEGIQRASS